MAKKKVSDTIEQQRKARAEFLKLKQMQQGEITPEPKPSEVAVVPKTFSEKMANIWFHYKYVIIFSTLITALLIFLVAQCASKVESDLEVVYCSYKPCLDTEIAVMEEYFEQFAKDINKDGEIKVTVINCSYSPETASFEYKNTILQNLNYHISANSKAMIYITDSESIKYFDNLKIESGFFEKGPKPLKDDFFAKFDESRLGVYIPEELQISVRRMDISQKIDKDEAKEYFEVSKEIFEKVTNN